jgi:hypothetical protein
MKQSVSFGVVVAVLLLAGRAFAEDHICSQEVAFALSEYGIKVSDIKNAQFRRFADLTSGRARSAESADATPRKTYLFFCYNDLSYFTRVYKTHTIGVSTHMG